MPAHKKHSSIRARGDRASTSAILSADSSAAEVPELPPATEWHPLTVQWWEDLWAAPMSSEYHYSDRHALYILAVLVDAFWKAPSKELASEIRLQRVAFGMTPYDRRKLEWTIEATEEAKDRGSQRRRTVTIPVGPDPRQALAN
jgi:hypothetical protein